jgi:hypothetical protein
VHTTTARVRGVIAASSASSRTVNSGGCSVTNSGMNPPTMAAFR